MQRNPSQTERLKTLINSNHFKTADALSLIRAGADPDVKNANGDTILHLLVKYNIFSRDSHNNKAITDLVKECGAKINIKNGNDKTPLQVLLDDTGFLT